MKGELIHFFERKFSGKDVACVSKWLTFTDHHNFSFNIQMCVSQKISWYKFVCQNTTLISLPTPPAISDFWKGRRKKALREAPGWFSLRYYIFYITISFLLPFYPNLVNYVPLICFHRSPPPHHPCFLPFLLSFSGPFYFFHLLLSTKWSNLNAVYMVRECKWLL